MNLNEPGSLRLLSEQIHKDIDSYCVWKYNDGPRSHLGASEIGKPCARQLWYKFRWMHHSVEEGRQYRLFQRGHLEEARIHDYLSGIGCDVKIFDKVLLYHPESDSYFYDSADNITDTVVEVEDLPEHEAIAAKLGVFLDKGKRQIRISDCDGHFGGSIDAKIKLPIRYQIEQDVLFLGEYKTQGTQKFAKLQTQGVQTFKYVHFCQQSTYGYKLGLDYAIYIAVNKNDDDLHVEVIKLDHRLGQMMIEKAQSIIYAAEPPDKISASSSFFECKWCKEAGVCWYNKSILVNCRSCYYAVPTKEAQWYCNNYKSIIPKDVILNACGKWKGLPV